MGLWSIKDIMSLLSASRLSLRSFKTSGAHLGLSQVNRSSSQATSTIDSDDAGEFRQLEIRPPRFTDKPKRRARFSMLMEKDFKRADKIDPDTVDWKSVWPGPRTFDPNAIPIPVRQGRLKPRTRPFNKYANLELMKIPAFFHLTKQHIQAQCEVLKKFCTKFPEELKDQSVCEEHFPLTVITSDYLHSAPTIRDPLARIVTLKLNLKHIPLDGHARDKLMRLVKDRYDDKTGILTIVTDRCPLRKQNYDYAQYLLTALFFESWTVEEWESEKTEADMEEYVWENNKSSRALASILKWTPDKLGKSLCDEPLPSQELNQIHHAYSSAVKDIIEGETQGKLQDYKEAALQILIPHVKEQVTT